MRQRCEARIGNELKLFLGSGAVMLLLLASPPASAQAKNYGFFRFDLGFFGSYSPPSGLKGGGLVLEPMFNVTDRFSAGLRVDLGGMGGASVDAAGTSGSAGALGLINFQGKAEYYFLDGVIRPFAGLATGLYYLAGGSVDVGTTGGSIEAGVGPKFGLAPVVGVELSIVRLSVFYAVIIGADYETVSVTAGQPPSTESKRKDYLGIELAFRIGGGRKSAPPPQAEPPPAPPPAPAAAPYVPPTEPAPTTPPPGEPQTK
jgi:hypothetical protein